MTKYSTIFRFVFSIIICELAGLVGSIFTATNINTWYASLIRPSISPPNWIFAPVWTLLFALMGCALFFIWQEQIKNTDEKRGKDILLALKIFFFQLLLNIFWSIIFFGFRSPDLAFFEILILWLTILLSIFAFYKIKKISAYFLVPYILWVTFAGYLNYLIWMLNY